MKLSIIIVTYNSAAFIGPCLQSLRLACAALQAELIVVDNGSRDHTLEAVRTEWPGAIILRNSTNRGFAAANNQGARVSQGEYLLLLNADTVLLDQNLAAALAYAEREQVAILGPKMVGKDGQLQRTWNVSNNISSYLSDVFSLAVFARHFRRTETPGSTVPMPVRFLVGAALLISRTAYSQHGLFDERYFFCCEERDLCFRYASLGEKLVYFPEWCVLHYGGGGETASQFHLDNWITGSFLFADKYGALRERILVRLVFLLFLLTNGAAFLLKGVVRFNRQYWRLARLYAGAVFRISRLYSSCLIVRDPMGR